MDINYLTELYLPTYQESFTDIMAIVRNAPRKNIFSSINYSTLNYKNLLPISQADFSISQSNVSDQRFFGEDVDRNIFKTGEIELKINATMPIFVPNTGFVDLSFAQIWELCRNAHLGTSNTIIGRCLNEYTSGSINIKISNIAEFTDIDLPFPVLINNINYIATNVIKKENTIQLESPLISNISIGTNVSTGSISSSPQPLTEPCFSLITGLNGLYSPCILNKISLTITPSNFIDCSFEILALDIYREESIEFSKHKLDIIKTKASRPTILNRLDGFISKISFYDNEQKDWGIYDLNFDPITGGFQSKNIKNININNITLSINNNLTPIWTPNTRNTNKSLQQRLNQFVYAYRSGGRDISGQITYTQQYNDYSFGERLSGIKNGGMIIDFGTFKIKIPNITWAPSQSNENLENKVERKIEYSMVSPNKQNNYPSLESSDLF